MSLSVRRPCHSSTSNCRAESDVDIITVHRSEISNGCRRLKLIVKIAILFQQDSDVYQSFPVHKDLQGFHVRSVGAVGPAPYGAQSWLLSTPIFIGHTSYEAHNDAGVNSYRRSVSSIDIAALAGAALEHWKDAMG